MTSSVWLEPFKTLNTLKSLDDSSTNPTTLPPALPPSSILASYSYIKMAPMSYKYEYKYEYFE
jgi:hypothetical protein